ncbi:NAD(+) synthase [Bittarella massiliensis (ex Durand et al. 2017)]|uniref:NAD(+) synthase n=1 Tax=Bittarella massiliensis (ex Durand et al. 2017) TaxID=1720313 RepID=UPI001AA0B455|nr:NAD(+) synthase [Bittarella massiliensis (ex Durand et al. 2017)]MBO1680088.1 NAD(+) synthase [Bittarella massiliensis (ex Durand et al. 2017)]
MRDGFLKVAVGSPDLRVADCAYNAAASARLLREAAAQRVKLLVLPELGLTGYSCGDLFLQPVLLQGAEAALEQLLQVSGELGDLVAVAGLPVRVGGGLYNCAAVLQGGRLLGVVPKRNLPNYGEFYERRQFTPGPFCGGEISLCGQRIPFGADLLFCCRELPDWVLGVEICEDLWVPLPPSVGLALAGATVLANPSASNETAGKADYRRQLVVGQSARLLAGYLYASAGAGESTAELVFAGHNLIAENGVLLAESPLLRGGLTCSELDLQRLAFARSRRDPFPAPAGEYRRVSFSVLVEETALTRAVERDPFVPAPGPEREERCGEVLALQIAGLAGRLRHTGCRPVLGLSGGLDSALALLVCVGAADALDRPRADVLAVSMPGFGTTLRTRENARRLALSLGVTFREISIVRAAEGHLNDIGHPRGRTDTTYENAQARERTQVLMDLANAGGGLVVGTGDLSELALGWATYGGDQLSMYAVNASVPKTLVRHLVAFAAARAGGESAAVLRDVLATPVSPELLPAGAGGGIAQRTESLVGPYRLHDFFLYRAIRCGEPPRKVYRLACIAFAGEFPAGEILRWLRLFYRRFFAQQFKRSALPDGPKVGELSPRGDWRMPSDGSAALWLEQLEGLEGRG